MTNNKHLRWAKIVFGTLSIIISMASSYFGILGYLDTFVGHEGLKGILSFFLVLLFIWGANKLLFTEWAKDRDKFDFD